MAIFAFDVEVSTHGGLRNGVTAVHLHNESLMLEGPSDRTWHRVTVEAETLEDAALLAAQLGSCVPRDMLPQFPVGDVSAEDDNDRKAIITAVFPRI